MKIYVNVMLINVNVKIGKIRKIEKLWKVRKIGKAGEVRKVRKIEKIGKVGEIENDELTLNTQIAPMLRSVDKRSVIV